MTTVRFFYDGDRINAVETKGHTGYARSGKDIVCAAVSVLVQTALLALDKVAGAVVQKQEKEGYLYYKITSSDTDTLHKSDIILKSIKVGLADICTQYPSYVKIEETKNVY